MRKIERRIIELYDSGLSMSEVSKEVGKSVSRVHAIVNKYGKPRSRKESLKLARAKGKCGVKLTPQKKKLLENKAILECEYSTQSITEIAKKYKMDKKLISAAIDKHQIQRKSWLDKAHDAQRKKIDDNLPSELLDENWLRRKYEVELMSTEDIAELLGVSITAVRTKFKKFGIKCRPPKKFGYGQKVTTSKGVSTYYYPIKNKCNKIRFRSLLECAYGIYLDNNNKVDSWEYETKIIYYFDSYTGKQRKYICDFSIKYIDGSIEHIEVKPLDLQTFEDKYLYAQNIIENWRFTTNDEIDQSMKLLANDDWPIEFDNTIPNSKKFWIWSKTDKIPIKLPNGYRVIRRSKELNRFYKFKIINDNLIINKRKKEHIKKPRHAKNKSDVYLDLDKILQMIKEDLSQTAIADKVGVSPRTIKKFLEDRSYVILWSGTSNKRNQILHATEKIWPPKDKPQIKEFSCRKNYYWDNYEWLYKHYVIKKMSTREIGNIVGKSGRLISKKLKLRGIPARPAKPQRTK